MYVAKSLRTAVSLSRSRSICAGGVLSPLCRSYSSSKFTFSPSSSSSHDSEDGAETQATSSSEQPAQRAWSWIPPRDSKAEVSQAASATDAEIPVLVGVDLTTEEIVASLEKQGADEIKVLPLNPPQLNITHFVIANGRSPKHLMKMAEVFVRALKARKLSNAPGYRGMDGQDGDDWIAVDCDILVVHLMLPLTRRSIRLEALWDGTDVIPDFTVPPDHPQYEKEFVKLLEAHPIPDDYFEYTMRGEVSSSSSSSSASVGGNKVRSSGFKRIPKNVHSL